MPSPQSVHPARETPFSTSTADDRIIYEITASSQLPLVNVARSVRSVCLRGDAEQAYIRIMNRWKVVILGGYTLGFLAFWGVLVAPVPIGRGLAVVGAILTIFMSAVYSLVLRYDIVCLVVHTYEFWFFSISNLVSAVLLALYLSDVRAVMTVAVWLILQNNILTDANTVFSKGYVAAAIGVLLFLVFLIATIMFGFIDGVDEFELLRLDANRRLVVQDALIHGYSTQAIMLARNIYRRWTIPTRPRSSQRSVRTMTCVTLRARVKLRRVDEGAPKLMEILPRDHSRIEQVDGSTQVRLQLVAVDERFLANEISVPSVSRLVFTTDVFTRNALRTMLLVVAYTGLLLTLVAVMLPNATYSNEIRVVSLTCTAVYVGGITMTTQRHLLARLVSTFDFAFLSTQLLVVHACLCDMLSWGSYCLPVVTIWLWIQWVLTSDALTPVVKAKWGVKRKLPATIMLVFIVSQLLIFVAIVVEDTIELRNRVIICFTIHQHVVEVKVIPTLLSRMVILFGWSWKVLWRMWTIRDDELLIIQGSMTYVNLRRQDTHVAAATASVDGLITSPLNPILDVTK